MLLINYSEGLGSLGSCWTLLHNPYSPFLVLTLGYPGRLHCNVLREVIHVDQSQDSKCVTHQQKFGQKAYFHLVDFQYLLIIFLIQLNRSELILWAAHGHCRQDEVVYLLFCIVEICHPKNVPGLTKLVTPSHPLCFIWADT